MSRFIAIAGTIGAGKSSLVDFLGARYGFDPIYEPFTDNPYLDDFYKDMPEYAFRSQIYFLTHKFRLHLSVNDHPTTLVQDRTIYEDAEIFCRNLFERGDMSATDHQTYMELYDSMRAVLRPPDLMIYLRCSVKAVRKRIRHRGRASEQAIPPAYLKSLHRLYESWIGSYTMSPVMVWDSERMDYLSDLVDQLSFEEALCTHLPDVMERMAQGASSRARIRTEPKEEQR